MRDGDDVVAHIELLCGDHCGDAEEISESAPVPARRESPIATGINSFVEVKASFEVLLFPAASSAVGAYVVVLRGDS